MLYNRIPPLTQRLFPIRLRTVVCALVIVPLPGSRLYHPFCIFRWDQTVRSGNDLTAFIGSARIDTSGKFPEQSSNTPSERKSINYETLLKRLNYYEPAGLGSFREQTFPEFLRVEYSATLFGTQFGRCALCYVLSIPSSITVYIHIKRLALVLITLFVR